jgi:hypothetical protein
LLSYHASVIRRFATGNLIASIVFTLIEKKLSFCAVTSQLIPSTRFTQYSCDNFLLSAPLLTKDSNTSIIRTALFFHVI